MVFSQLFLQSVQASKLYNKIIILNYSDLCNCELNDLIEVKKCWKDKQNFLS